ncbi:MAG: nitroreductase family protein [Bacteroidales bacterium]
MAIPTSRTKEPGSVTIDIENCDGCGLCVKVCGDNTLVMSDGKAAVSDTPVFGCIGCGHCMAICPHDAIKVTGRTLSPDDLFTLPDSGEAADYNQLLSLLKRRRSVREFQKRPVEPDVIEKILAAAKTSPMGLPPSDVNVLIFDKVEKSREFVTDFCKMLERMKWFASPWFLALMRPFWGKANDELFRNFIRPLFSIYPGNLKKGENSVTYDAPLVMYFYGSPWADPADPLIAAATAMYAGESLGLGTCMLGAVHPFIQNSGARRLREKYGIKYKCREGLLVIFGYPAVRYSKGIKRSFASVTTYS